MFHKVIHWGPYQGLTIHRENEDANRQFWEKDQVGFVLHMPASAILLRWPSSSSHPACWRSAPGVMFVSGEHCLPAVQCCGAATFLGGSGTSSDSDPIISAPAPAPAPDIKGGSDSGSRH